MSIQNGPSPEPNSHSGGSGIRSTNEAGASPQGFGAGQDVFPDFAVSPEEVTRRTRMLQDYVRHHMVEGEDYGIMPGGSKPTLFKPGAEKLNAVYGLSPIVEVTNRMENWDDGFVAYEVKVTLLNKRSGQIEAEGIGSCNSRERRYKNQDAAGSANTVLKMAKKRALVDATLSATRASGMFTQDLEDVDFETERGGARGYERPVDKGAERTVESSGPRGARSGPGNRPEGAPQPPWEALTEKQRGMILAIGGRVFGMQTREEDLRKLVEKPLEQLSKMEASALIDKLQTMLPRDAGAASHGERSSRNS